MQAYVGADWSAKEIVCSTALEVEKPRRISGARRTYASVCDLVQRVRQRHPEADEVVVAIEAGAPGWVDLLHHAGATVLVADPRQVKAFAKSMCSSGAKDDARDSALLVHFGRSASHQPEPYQASDEVRAQVGNLDALYETVSQQRTSTSQRLRSWLREHFAPLEAVLRDLGLRWVGRVLRAVPTPWHAAQLTPEAFEEILRGCGARHTTRDRLRQALRAGNAPWLSESLAQTHAQYVCVLLDQIELFSRQLRDLEQRMDELTAGIDVVQDLQSIGGVGKRLACRLLRFVLDEPPAHRDAFGIKLGASPVFVGSGKTRDGRPKGHIAMRRAAQSGARQTSYLLGRLASQQLDWAKAQYQHAIARGKNSPTAYRIVARSLLRIIAAMVRTGQPYDDARYVAALQRHGVPWAVALPASA